MKFIFTHYVSNAPASKHAYNTLLLHADADDISKINVLLQVEMVEYS